MKRLIVILSVVLIAAGGLHSQVQWAARYDGSVHYIDYASDVKVVLGRAYVAGSSWGQNTNSDFVVVKYNVTNGAMEWEYRYNSPDSGTDNANSIASDIFGNVYVTGTVSHTNSTGDDIFTVCLDASGGIRWTKEYTGPGNGADQGVKIMADGLGNMYVMGTTTSAAGDFDIIVIKYNSTGNEIWHKQYQSPQYQVPTDMYVNTETGDVFVTGVTGNTNSDYITLMITSQGVVQWVKQYGGTANATDVSYSIGHDVGNGDVFVTGTSDNTGGLQGITTICYNKNGDQRWVSRYDAPVTGGTAAGCDVESAGDIIYVSGYSNETNLNQKAGLILGLDTTGAMIWKRSYTGRTGNFSSQNIPTDLKVDWSGNAFISATSYDSAFGIGYNFMLVQTNPSGNMMTNEYNSTSNDVTAALDIYTTNIVITGLSDTAGQSRDMLTAAFKNNSTGKYTSNRHKPIGPFSDSPDSMQVRKAAHYGDAAEVVKVKLTLDTIIFPQCGDLEIYLEHNNITDTLVFHSGGAGDNFIATELDDAASVPVSGATAPFTGTFKPKSPLAVLNGSDIEGIWVLKIKNSGSYAGMLYGWTLQFEIDENTIGVPTVSNNIPSAYSLSQNYPNPFNPKTTINFQLAKGGNTKLIVYDILGREIETLVNDNLKAGSYKADFDGSKHSSGVYFYRLVTDEFSETKKMLLVK